MSFIVILVCKQRSSIATTYCDVWPHRMPFYRWTSLSHCVYTDGKLQQQLTVERPYPRRSDQRHMFYTLYTPSVCLALDLCFYIFGVRQLAAGWSYIFFHWWARSRVPFSINQIASPLTAIYVSSESGTSDVLSCLSCSRPSACSLPLKRRSV